MAALVFEGFLQSVGMHSLRYHNGDCGWNSGVYTQLFDTGSNKLIHKLGCRDHFMRYIRNKLEDVSKIRHQADVKRYSKYI